MKCTKCGEDLVLTLKEGENRSFPWLRSRYSIPSEVPLPTCSACGATYLDDVECKFLSTYPGVVNIAEGAPLNEDQQKIADILGLFSSPQTVRVDTRHLNWNLVPKGHYTSLLKAYLEETGASFGISWGDGSFESACEMIYGIIKGTIESQELDLSSLEPV